MLAKKQTELLLYINQRIIEDGVSPSFEEMKDALKLRSKSGIHRLITGLEERGFLRRLPHRARALEVLRLPDTAGRKPGSGTPVVVAKEAGGGQVVQASFRPRQPAARAGETAAIPLYGRIAAGLPIEALRDPSTFLELPPSLLGNGSYYALEVDGDSMIQAGILDGD